MISNTVRIQLQAGIHAKPAAIFVKLANSFESDIKVKKNEIEIDGKSVMGFLMLVLTKDDEIIISAKGKDEQKAIKELSSLVENSFEREDIL